MNDYFLGFIDEDNRKTKRISYAASFGAPKWEYDAEQTETVRTLIKRFDAVSVREDSAVELCKSHMDMSAKHVLDPTMLLRADHYAPLFSSAGSRPSDNQLLSYILDRSEDKMRVVETLAERLSVRAYATDGQLFDRADGTETEGDKSVEGWLASIRNAAFVITDSFHGTAFSILFNKPFIAYGNAHRGLARFTSLVKMFGLEDRLIINSSKIEIEKILQPIDWATVNQRLDALRLESIQFLVDALSGDSPLADSPSNTAATQISTPVQQHPLKVMCTGCGVCVSESEGTLRMDWNDDGFLVPQAISGKVPSEAVRVCPFNPHPMKEVEDEDVLAETFLPDAPQFDPRAGRFVNTYIGYSKDFRPTSSSGGIASYVFHKLLTMGHVDYLFIVQSDGADGYRYRVFDRSGDIQRLSKTRYYPVSMDELFAVIERTPGRVAVSGVACFIKAIRLKQHYHPELRQRIPFLVGLICGGLKSRLYTDFLAQSAGIDGKYTNAEYRLKNPNSSSNDYSFSAVDEQLQTHKIRMSGLGDMWGSGFFKSKACDFCTDVATELADISLGDAWLPQYRPDGMGTSVIVTRSPLADQIIRLGIETGELVIDSAPMSLILQSQGGGTGHKHNTIKFRVWLATYFSDLPVPAVRARLMKNISLSDAWVQLHRERTRSKSIEYWRATRNVKAFNVKMRTSRKSLATATAMRQNMRNNGSHPLAEAMLTRRVGALRRNISAETRENRVMLRWIWRKVRGNQFEFELLRSALLSAQVISLPEK